MPLNHTSSSNSNNKRKNGLTNKKNTKSTNKIRASKTNSSKNKANKVQSNSNAKYKSRSHNNIERNRSNSLKTRSHSAPVNNNFNKLNLKRATLKKVTPKNGNYNIEVQPGNTPTKNIFKASLLTTSRTSKKTNGEILKNSQLAKVAKLPTANTTKVINKNLLKTPKQSNITKISGSNLSRGTNLKQEKIKVFPKAKLLLKLNQKNKSKKSNSLGKVVIRSALIVPNPKSKSVGTIPKGTKTTAKRNQSPVTTQPNNQLPFNSSASVKNCKPGETKSKCPHGIPEKAKTSVNRNNFTRKSNTIPTMKKEINDTVGRKNSKKSTFGSSSIPKFLSVSQSLTQTTQMTSNMVHIGLEKDFKLLYPSNEAILTKTNWIPAQNASTKSLRSNPKQILSSKDKKGERIKSLSVLKKIAELAKRNGCTYIINEFLPGLQKAFKERYWVEKILPTNKATKGLYYQSFSFLQNIMRAPAKRKLCEQIIISHYIEKVDFYWRLPYNTSLTEMKKYKYVNRFPLQTFSYTTKKNISDSLRNGNFVTHDNKIYKIAHPRTYSLRHGAINQEFVEDYRITAAMSLLKWVLYNNSTTTMKLISPSGKIPVAVYMFAANECCKFLSRKTHRNSQIRFQLASKNEWNTFLQYFQYIIYFGHHFRSNKNITPEYLVRRSKLILENLEMHCRYLQIDGYNNLWLLKPYNNCQGRGIHLFRTLGEILQYISNYNKQFFLIQKYIERPLLIYNTKFDIRQWFLITDLVPLKIWMYKKCYLKFSTQTFSLRRLHESIHLTNNCVQKKYENSPNDVVLPKYSMWDVDQFKTYLSNIGYPNVYDRKIYEGMKQCIIGTTITNFKSTKDVKNCFQLFGADFIITDDFEPWLLEINPEPAMYDSTPVTRRLAEQCFRDLLKVLVDYRRNPQANTGHFELIFNNTLLRPHKKIEHGSTTEIPIANRTVVSSEKLSLPLLTQQSEATIKLVEPKEQQDTVSAVNSKCLLKSIDTKSSKIVDEGKQNAIVKQIRNLLSRICGVSSIIKDAITKHIWNRVANHVVLIAQRFRSILPLK